MLDDLHNINGSKRRLLRNKELSIEITRLRYSKTVIIDRQMENNVRTTKKIMRRYEKMEKLRLRDLDIEDLLKTIAVRFQRT